MSESSSATPPNDPSIPFDEVVYRRVRDDDANMVETDEGRQPSSAAFADDVDGMSVYLRSELERLGKVPADVVAGLSGTYRVVALEVGAIRSLGLGVTADPNPADSDHPCDPAHALVRYPDGLGKRARLRLQRELKAIAQLLPHEA